MVKYELVTAMDDEESWDVVIQSGYYEDTVIRFKTLSVNEENETLSFDYFIVSTPLTDLTEQNEGLQEAVKQVLAQILESALNEMEENMNKELEQAVSKEQG